MHLSDYRGLIAHHVVNLEVVSECRPYGHGLVEWIDEFLPRLPAVHYITTIFSSFCVEIIRSGVKRRAARLDGFLEGQSSFISLVN